MPPVCRLCSAPGLDHLDLCCDCWADLPLPGFQCPVCATQQAQQRVCGRCLSSPPAYDRVRAPFAYRRPLDTFVSQLKFQRQRAYARLLAQLWIAKAEVTSLPSAVIPIPLDRQRLRSRGFNQAQLIAQLLARRLKIQCHTPLRKLRSTKPQMELNAKRRRKNLRGAFELDRAYRPPGHVAIVDDVMTTGATAHEAAALLRQAGAQSIEVWVCARA